MTEWSNQHIQTYRRKKKQNNASISIHLNCSASMPRHEQREVGF